MFAESRLDKETQTVIISSFQIISGTFSSREI